MGAVWRAEHIDLGTPAAVKLIDESYVQSPEALTRFRREAQAAASLRSANVVQILDYGLDGDTPFIAMELLEGESLADRMEHKYRLEPIECASILLQVSKALAKAHDQGIVHRDLKPDNIFLVRDGDDEIAKVLDFGIAKRTSAFQTSADMATRTGSLMGTPYYMSPEQASGRRQVDQRTDIWAFAVIAYECVTGQRPYDDTNLGGLLLSICTEPPKPPSSVAVVPNGFDEWFHRCTIKDPAGRPSSIREAAHELCRVCGMQVPSSRLASYSQVEAQAFGPAENAAVQSVTSPWRDGTARPSMVTPGGVAKSLGNAEPGARDAPTIQLAKRKTPIVVQVSAAVAALGVLSAVAALAMRHSGQSAAAEVSAEPSAPLAVTAVKTNPALGLGPAPGPAPGVTPAATPGVAPMAPSSLPTPSNTASGTAPTGAPAKLETSGIAAATTPKGSVAKTSTQAKTSQVRTRAKQTTPQAASPALRPQDRLERDLGF